MLQTETVQSRVHKSLKVWSLYADLEESFGTFKVCLLFLGKLKKVFGIICKEI